MALTTLTIACFLLYGTSKYFPIKGIEILKEQRGKIVLLASAISLFSLYLFNRSFDFSTSLMVWMSAFMLLLSAIILSIKMNEKSVWVWGAFCILFILIDIG